MVLRDQDEFPRVPITNTLAGDWEDGVFYPSDDGLPMGENEAHIQAILDTMAKLQFWCEEYHRDFYVTGDMFYYWERGNPRATVAPDILVARGVPRQSRRKSYKLWHEGVIPSVVFEFISEESQRRDLVEKPRRYAQIGIPEYFVFDPLGEMMDPPLQGYRLAGTHYVHLFPDLDGWLHSEQLGIKLNAEGEELLLMDVATGELILKSDVRARRAKAEADHAKAEADHAKAEADRAKTETETERVRREAAETEAAAARAQAEASNAEVARFLARLAELEGKQDGH